MVPQLHESTMPSCTSGGGRGLLEPQCRACMAINIRNAETERLARLVAQEANETMTEAIMVALRERLGKLRAMRSVNERIEAIVRVASQCASLPDEGPK